MDAYDRFCERDAAFERAEDALARYEAAFNEGVDTLAEVARAVYEIRERAGSDDAVGEAA